jgi:hypothetical protein
VITELRSLVRALDGDVVGNQVLAPGPGHGPRDRSLSVRLSATAPDGFLAFSHAGDDWQACRDYVKQRLGLDRDGWKRERPAALKRPAPAPADEGDDRGKKIADAIELWRDSVDPRGTVVQAYLKSRVLALDDDVAGSVIRWNPRIGAMIALFRNILTDEPQAVWHWCTRLALAGGGACARKIRPAAAGPAIRPAPILAGCPRLSGPTRRDGAVSRPADPRWRGKVG